jgi:hypothetical protein
MKSRRKSEGDLFLDAPLLGDPDEERGCFP